MQTRKQPSSTQSRDYAGAAAGSRKRHCIHSGARRLTEPSCALRNSVTLHMVLWSDLRARPFRPTNNRVQLDCGYPHPSLLCVEDADCASQDVHHSRLDAIVKHRVPNLLLVAAWPLGSSITARELKRGSRFVNVCLHVPSVRCACVGVDILENVRMSPPGMLPCCCRSRAVAEQERIMHRRTNRTAARLAAHPCSCCRCIPGLPAPRWLVKQAVREL